ncbi:MAG TPA: hypothetical protein VIL35_13610 [Vicinamibacterales bacterium]
MDVKITIVTPEKPIVKAMTLVASDGQLALGRSWLEIPIKTGGASLGPAGVQTPVSIQHKNVNFSVDARPRVLEGNRIGVNLKMAFSTVYSGDSAESLGPTFGNGSSDMYLVFENGRWIVVSEATDSESGRGFKVEAKATLLK